MSGDRRIRVGKIVGVTGIQGWVKLESDTDPRRNIFSYTPWILIHRGVETQIDSVVGREQGKGLVGHWAALESRDAAAEWIGAEIWVSRSSLPASPPGEYYWVDLERLRGIGGDGLECGRISHLFSTGANDVMSVVGDRERLIPFLQGSVVRHVDMNAGTVEVEWDPEF